MNDTITDDDFLRLCSGKDTEAAVRKVLQQHPELVTCRNTRPRRSGCTGLHVASRSGNVAVVQLLLEHGGDVDVRDKCGRSALHVAACSGHGDVVQLLLEHGGEVNARRSDGWTPLHQACAHNVGEEVVRVLLDGGADVNARDTSGATCLHFASFLGLGKFVRVLLEHGTQVDARDVHGWSALRRAAGEGHEEVVRVLLVFGADRSIKHGDGETARYLAECRGHHQVVALLDTYFPAMLQMVQVLLGVRGPTESPLTRLAAHDLFEPEVLSLVKCLLSGEENAAFEQLQRDARC